MTPADLKKLETDLRAMIHRVPRDLPGLRSDIRRAANTAGSIELAPRPPAAPAPVAEAKPPAAAAPPK